MVFCKVMLIYGVPKNVMGCGYNIDGDGFCQTGHICICNMCKYELVDSDDVWIYPCCSKVKAFIKGFKIGCIRKSKLDTKYGVASDGTPYIEAVYYVSSTGKQFGIDEIFQGVVVDPDFKVPKGINEKWSQIKENITTPTSSKPQVYLMLDDCTTCS